MEHIFPFCKSPVLGLLWAELGQELELFEAHLDQLGVHLVAFLPLADYLDLPNFLRLLFPEIKVNIL